MRQISQDLTIAFRLFRKHKVATAIAIACLGCGIGINTSVYSIASFLLFRPLPVPASDQVVTLTRGNTALFSYPDYEDLRDRNQVMTGMIATMPTETSLNIGDVSELVAGEAVTPNYGATLKTSPHLGRWFRDDDNVPNSEPTAVTSWQRNFASDPSVIGKRVRLESRDYIIIGVAAPTFSGLYPPFATQVWYPLDTYIRQRPEITKQFEMRDKPKVMVVGRLSSRVGLRQAQANLRAIDAQLRQEFPRPQLGNVPVSLQPTHGVTDPRNRAAVRVVLVVLISAVSLVLLIACLNIAALLLSQAMHRRQEIAIRMAVGASKLRVLRQVLTESLGLATLGTLVGLSLALLIDRMFEKLIPSLPEEVTLRPELTIDVRVLTTTVVLTVVSAIVFGLAPAWTATQVDVVAALKDSSSSFACSSRRPTLTLFVIVQMALSVVLLVSAGLYIRLLYQMSTSNPGFNPAGRVYARIYAASPPFTSETGAALYSRIVERIRHMPGIKDASITYSLPLTFPQYDCIAAEGSEPVPRMQTSTVGQGYFTTLGIPLLAGRDFDRVDTRTSPRTAIVNNKVAARFWPGQSPLGKRIRMGPGCDESAGTLVQVVGVVGNTRDSSMLTDEDPIVYVPYAQRYSGFVTLVVNAGDQAEAILTPLRRELHDSESKLQIFEVSTLSAHMYRSTWRIRWQATVMATFGLLALILAAVGQYGVLSYLVSQRTREIGIRMAIGAPPTALLRSIVTHGLSLVFIGGTVGLVLSLVVGQFLSRMLRGMRSIDPMTLTIVMILLCVVALIASYLPARRAARVDPLITLRAQ